MHVQNVFKISNHTELFYEFGIYTASKVSFIRCSFSLKLYPNIDNAYNKLKGYTNERKSLVPCTVQSVPDISVSAGVFVVWIISLEQSLQSALDSAAG